MSINKIKLWNLYVIRSEEGLIYTGISPNLKKRIEKHNAGLSYSTKKGKNWKIIYYESDLTSEQARKREKYFKNNAGKEWLKRNGYL